MWFSVAELQIWQSQMVVIGEIGNVGDFGGLPKAFLAELSLEIPCLSSYLSQFCSIGHGTSVI